MPLSVVGLSPVPPVGWCRLHLKEDLCVYVCVCVCVCVCGGVGGVRGWMGVAIYPIKYIMSHDLVQTHQYSD